MSAPGYRWLTPAPPMLNLDTNKVSRAVGRRIDRIAITLGPLGLEYPDGRQKWIEPGFPTDYASIPPSAQLLGRLLRSVGIIKHGVDPTDGATLRAVLGHDADYTLWDKLDVIWGRKLYPNRLDLAPDLDHPAPKASTRGQADKDLRAGLLLDATERAGAYYKAVRTFGHWSWYKQDTAMVDGWVAAVRAGTCRQWVDHVAFNYAPGGIVELEEAK